MDLDLSCMIFGIRASSDPIKLLGKMSSFDDRENPSTKLLFGSLNGHIQLFDWGEGLC